MEIFLSAIPTNSDVGKGPHEHPSESLYTQPTPAKVVEEPRFVPRVKTIALTVKQFRSVRGNQYMSSHVRGNQYCANRSMSREPKHLETCRMSFHVRGNQYCANRSMSRERKHLETCRSTKKSDCSPNSMLAQINARGNQYYLTSMPIPSFHLSIPRRIVNMFGSILFGTG